jgi:hypothetical protein
MDEVIQRGVENIEVNEGIFLNLMYFELHWQFIFMCLNSILSSKYYINGCKWDFSWIIDVLLLTLIMLVKMIGIHFLWKCVWILGHSLIPHLFHALVLASSLKLGTI